MPLLPDPLVADDDPERSVVEADSVGLALLIVLDTLAPAERVAFVLHDVFEVPFAELAVALDRSEAAVRQLASRGRRRVRAAPVPDPDLRRQRAVVRAFLAAARDGDLDGLVAVLDPQVELRARPDVTLRGGGGRRPRGGAVRGAGRAGAAGAGERIGGAAGAGRGAAGVHGAARADRRAGRVQRVGVDGDRARAAWRTGRVDPRQARRASVVRPDGRPRTRPLCRPRASSRCPRRRRRRRR
ncbi:hypothetical protein GCM10020218_064120 [Dactylosporangium vinaceum]